MTPIFVFKNTQLSLSGTKGTGKLLSTGSFLGKQCECAMNVKEQMNCGYAGISVKECKNVPWCFILQKVDCAKPT
uniref:P-type domain-containing protein n=1 Tax=Gopherus agassizii TaxID=38772 RepID=A0A452I0I3_9SAUR